MATDRWIWMMWLEIHGWDRSEGKWECDEGMCNDAICEKMCADFFPFSLRLARQLPEFELLPRN